MVQSSVCLIYFSFLFPSYRVFWLQKHVWLIYFKFPLKIAFLVSSLWHCFKHLLQSLLFSTLPTVSSYLTLVSCLIIWAYYFELAHFVHFCIPFCVSCLLINPSPGIHMKTVGELNTAYCSHHWPRQNGFWGNHGSGNEWSTNSYQERNYVSAQWKLRKETTSY